MVEIDGFALLAREIRSLRDEVRELRDVIELRGLRSSDPLFNAASGAEFTALFQAHRHLRDDVESLRRRLETYIDRPK